VPWFLRIARRGGVTLLLDLGRLTERYGIGHQAVASYRILVGDRHLIDEALKQGVRDAMLRHKEAGLPVVIYRDGKAVWVMPEDVGF